MTGLWDHFRTISVPAILEGQAIQGEEVQGPTLMETMVEYASHCRENAANSQVCCVIICDLYVCT